MQRILLPILFSVGTPAVAGEIQLTLHGTGIEGKNLFVAVHSSADEFPTRDTHALKSIVVARSDTVGHLIKNVPAGKYAVAVFADLNGNGELDSNFVGIPKEPVGISRNAQGKFGPPKFSDAVFAVGDGVTALAIELK
ncbi:MAG: DUF2141 domain-containing protein [Gallionellaceae bacterium]|jgi:uncharacterized protein (DUF2141 family)